MTITKTDTLQRMASPSIAPEIFTMNAIRNHYGFPSCDFSRRLTLSRRTLIDTGIPRTLTLAACTFITEFESPLNGRTTGALLNTGPLIEPLKTFRAVVGGTAPVLSSLVNGNADFGRADRRKVRSWLQMECKLRVLVALHYLDMVHLMVEPETWTNLDGWTKIRDDIKAAISGLFFICYLPQTFEDPNLGVRRSS